MHGDKRKASMSTFGTRSTVARNGTGFTMPPHCGWCDERTRMAEAPTGRVGPCPRCHLSTVGDSRQRPASGYQPYRNPVDQSVYLRPIG